MQAPEEHHITTAPVMRPVPIKLPSLLPSPARASYPQMFMVPNRTWSSTFAPASPQVVQMNNVAAMQMQVALLSQKALHRHLNRDELRQLQLLLFSLSSHNPMLPSTSASSPGNSSPSSSSPPSPISITHLPTPIIPAAPRATISLPMLSPMRHGLCPVPPPTVTTDSTSDNARERKLRVCVHCGTTKSTQWRRGPYKKAKLCNACGLRFSRNFARRMQNKQKEGQSNENKRSSIYDVLN